MINCTISVSCGMKQVYVWRYYLNNYHENWDKLHWIYKLWDEVGRCVWRFYPSNDQGGLRQTAMNQLWVEAVTCTWRYYLSNDGGELRQIAPNQYNVGWSSYMCLKVLSQQWSGGTEKTCTESVNCGMKQLYVLEGTISAMITGTQTNCDESVCSGMRQLHIFEGSKSATTRTDWDQLQWIRKLRDPAVMYVWRYTLSIDREGLRQMAAKKPQ
jgi:hypothetical protein